MVDAQLISDVGQFLYREARLLDERRHGEWLELLAEEFRYRVPLRTTRGADTVQSNGETRWDPEREFAPPEELQLMDETRASIAARIERARHPRAWADNPPARTRHLIGNIETEWEGGGMLRVFSTFIVHWYRHDEHRVLTGQRRDHLRHDAAGFKLSERLVLLDQTALPLNFLNVYL